MIHHLSPEQLPKFILGEATPDEHRHAAECVECRAEVMQLQETLSFFRESAHHWAVQSARSSVPRLELFPDEPSSFKWAWVRRALVAAALIILATIPLLKNTQERQIAPQTFDDTLLLEQVNAHLSRTVPTPMEPLMELFEDGFTNEVGEQE
jgi:anti-sigma factor RsiW